MLLRRLLVACFALTLAGSRSPAVGQIFGPEIPVGVIFGYQNSGGLATDRAGTWVLVGAGFLSPGDRDVLVTRSTDDAHTWTPVATLNTNAAGDTGDDKSASLATDAAGHWVAVWESKDSLGGTVGTEGDILVSRSSDGGATWTPPAPLNTDAASDAIADRAPSVITDEAGTWLAFWTRQSNGVAVSRSTDAGVTWTPPLVIGPDGLYFDEVSAPRAAVDGAGRVVAVWHTLDFEGHPGADVVVATSADLGASWTPAALLDPTNVNAQLWPRVATDGAGVWVAVWSQGSLVTPTIYRSRSTDGGATWSTPTLLSNNDVFDYAPDVTSAHAGNFVSVWGGTVFSGAATSSPDGGSTWTAPRDIPSFTFPVLITGDRAGLYVVAYPGAVRRGAVCGDGLLALGEECDDGNLTAGDGCEPTCTPTGCGDGALGAGEQCDDGNILPGDCCTPGCHLDPAGTACTDDGNLCTDDACNAAGTCQHTANTVSCDDGDLCTMTDHCGGGTCAGVAAPRPTCHGSASRLGSLLLRAGPPATRQRAVWTWKGPDPVLAGFSLQRHAFCVYDAGAGAQPRVHLDVDASPSCSVFPQPPNCWQAVGPRFDYHSADREPDGVKYLSLRGDSGGGGHVVLKASGANLAVPGTAFATPVTAQLVRDDEECWDATYSTPIRNVPASFKAKPD